jgi:hypothetical protein
MHFFHIKTLSLALPPRVSSLVISERYAKLQDLAAKRIPLASKLVMLRITPAIRQVVRAVSSGSQPIWHYADHCLGAVASFDATLVDALVDAFGASGQWKYPKPSQDERLFDGRRDSRKEATCERRPQRSEPYFSAATPRR